MIIDFIHSSAYVSFTSCDFSHLLIGIEKAVKICTLDATVFIVKETEFVIIGLYSLLTSHASTVYQRSVLLIPGTAHRLAALSCGPFTFWTCFSCHDIHLQIEPLRACTNSYFYPLHEHEPSCSSFWTYAIYSP